jgi:hypothetical protein
MNTPTIDRTGESPATSVEAVVGTVHEDADLDSVLDRLAKNFDALQAAQADEPAPNEPQVPSAFAASRE